LSNYFFALIRNHYNGVMDQSYQEYFGMFMVLGEEELSPNSKYIRWTLS